MVIVALDVGERRIGVAVADPEGRLATPIGAIVRRDGPATCEAIATVMRERGGTRLLVGVPLGPNGEETLRASAIREFARAVADHLALPVAFRDERHTTQDALARSREVRELPEGRRRGARRPPSPHAREAARRRIDAMAAAVLLQAHLDEVINEGQGQGPRHRSFSEYSLPAPSPERATAEERGAFDKCPRSQATPPADLSEALADALRDADDEVMPTGDAPAPSRAPGTRG